MSHLTGNIRFRTNWFSRVVAEVEVEVERTWRDVPGLRAPPRPGTDPDLGTKLIWRRFRLLDLLELDTLLKAEREKIRFLDGALTRQIEKVRLMKPHLKPMTTMNIPPAPAGHVRFCNRIDGKRCPGHRDGGHCKEVKPNPPAWFEGDENANPPTER